ncbi:endonuclease domain-containing protein [Arthrobacter sp. A2-55]|uniref:endonuclease domain-containing protein n=1 Tax=Arthrobacter sp. A2-55 TaxID=2897337 RepID=UPI0021CDA6CD|nr:endonuclease domain-containing protein [Arthrobacter sp. A2-55]MCU6479320.1 endonuclease domain-containing protein [Arthrobacter sp. A2-55]
MDTPADHPIPNSPFTLSEAESMGFTRDKLRGANFAGAGYGLYRPTSWEFTLPEAARALCAATPGAWISHTTAAQLHGLILPPWLEDSTELHLSKPRKLPETRRKGITGHTLLAFEDEIETVDGLAVSTRARTWLDLARVLPLPNLVCMGDQLIRIPRIVFEGRSEPYVTIASLRNMMARHGNLQGIVRARAALELMRVGSDSGPETMLRLAMLDAGLPEPELQLALWSTPNAPSADLGYRKRRIAIQYDGGTHNDELQANSDARRNAAFRNAGWDVLIFDRGHLADGFDSAVRQIKAAMRRAWTDPAVVAGFAASG